MSLELKNGPLIPEYEPMPGSTDVSVRKINQEFTGIIIVTLILFIIVMIMYFIIKSIQWAVSTEHLTDPEVDTLQNDLIIVHKNLVQVTQSNLINKTYCSKHADAVADELVKTMSAWSQADQNIFCGKITKEYMYAYLMNDLCSTFPAASKPPECNNKSPVTINEVYEMLKKVYANQLQNQRLSIGTHMFMAGNFGQQAELEETTRAKYLAMAKIVENILDVVSRDICPGNKLNFEKLKIMIMAGHTSLCGFKQHNNPDMNFSTAITQFATNYKTMAKNMANKASTIPKPPGGLAVKASGSPGNVLNAVQSGTPVSSNLTNLVANPRSVAAVPSGPIPLAANVPVITKPPRAQAPVPAASAASSASAIKSSASSAAQAAIATISSEIKK
jgi:Na+-transporting methylmalonyl-CoA/oxaloacetate decarboxylase gamma subunit